MEVELKTQEKERNILEFTGNWFFDLGILGFVNLMEEVYDWNLEELKRQIENLKKEKLNNLFLIAFWVKVIKDTVIREVDKAKMDKKSKEDINRKLFQYIKDIRSVLHNSRLNIDKTFAISFILKLNQEIKNELIKYGLEKFRNKGLVAFNGFFTNSFFNSSRNKKGNERKIIKYFYNVIENYFVRLDKKDKYIPTDVIDKSLSPFIYSASDFRNEYYGRANGLKEIEKTFNINPIYSIASVPFSFINNYKMNFCFYTPDISLTYEINKRIKIAFEKNSDGSYEDILALTWESVIDKLIEEKASFMLENMYLIEYKTIVNQKFIDVEYIGISKLKAKILLNEDIRGSINRTVSLKVGKETKNIWILEEFIKNKPLLPIILNHMRDFLNKKVKLAHVSSLPYALSIDLILKELEKENKRTVNIFDDGFFTTYPEVIKRIKNNKRIMNSLKSQVSQIFADLKNEEKERLAQILTSMVIKGNRTNFVNFLLKWILKQEIKEKNNLFNLMIEYILNNENWKHFALSIILGLISGGEGKND